MTSCTFQKDEWGTQLFPRVLFPSLLSRVKVTWVFSSLLDTYSQGVCAVSQASELRKWKASPEKGYQVTGKLEINMHVCSPHPHTHALPSPPWIHRLQIKVPKDSLAVSSNCETYPCSNNTESYPKAVSAEVERKRQDTHRSEVCK